MPISLALPLGLVIALVGAILLFVTKYKRIAKILIGIGLTVAILTFIVVLLAVNSQM